MCGCDLPEGWHADHINPYSQGGETDITNAQALCPTCNLKKGASVMSIAYAPWPQGFSPRSWQIEFLDDYFTKDREDYLVYATPGAGKTFAALFVAYQLLRRNVVQQLVIVSPTDNLRTQWIEQASYLGIDLTYVGVDRRSLRATYSRDDYIGVSVTYAEVNNKRHELRSMCSSRPTLVILDEIHHCGNDELGSSLEWGPAVEQAFMPCVKRLSLSGTPFRNDNHRIPFVEYEKGDDGLMWARLDYEYGYGRALQDSSGKDYKGVVRPITFPVFDSRVGWIDLTGEYSKYLSEVGDKDRAKALRVALDPNGEYVHEMLKHADGRLNAIRKTSNHKDAGGLVIARNTADANEIAQILYKISGQEPVVIHSNMEVDDTNAVIDDFRNSTDKWIVSVKMISEGVDIKRLRVGVYLSNIHSRVFFQQAIGRVIRWVDGVEMQMAFFYFPQLEPWLQYMKDITEVVRDKFDPSREAFGRLVDSGGGGIVSQSELFLPIYGEVTEQSQVHDSQKFDERTLTDGVQAFIRNVPAVGYDFVRVIGEAKITSIAIQAGFINDVPRQREKPKPQKPLVKHEEHTEWKRKANGIIKQYASILFNRGQYRSLGEAIKAINTMYGREFGFQADDNSISYYQHKAQWARNKMAQL